MRTPEGTGYMDDDLYIKILQDIVKNDPLFDARFCPYLANEPFCDKKIVERIRIAYDYLPDMELEVSTNAELMDEARMKQMINIITSRNTNPKTKIKISFFGYDKESLEDMMHINYEKTLHNIINLIKYNNGRVPIVITGLGLSRDEKVKIYNASKYKRFWARVIDEHNLSRKNLRIQYYSFHNRAGTVELDGWDYNTIVRKIDRNHPFDCWRLHNTLHVLWNGDLTLCCMSPYRHEAIFGNLKHQTIKEAFESEEWKRLYNQARGLEPSPPDFICKRCMSPGG